MRIDLRCRSSTFSESIWREGASKSAPADRGDVERLPLGGLVTADLCLTRERSRSNLVSAFDTQR